MVQPDHSESNTTGHILEREGARAENRRLHPALQSAPETVCLDSDCRFNSGQDQTTFSSYLGDGTLGRKDVPILFQALGPSPFHANLYLSRENASKATKSVNPRSSIFTCTQVHQRGYDLIEFTYSPESYKTDKAAMERLIDFLSDELGLFYRIRSLQSADYRGWDEIQNNSIKLLELQKKKGANAFLQRFFNSGRLVRQTLADITSFAADGYFNRQNIQRFLSDMYDGRRDTYLYEYIKREYDRREGFPISEISESVKFIAASVGKVWEMTIVLIAALLGGGVGAIVALLLK